MIQKFLKAKHWQLFTLMFGIPFGFQIIMLISMFSNFDIESNPDPKLMFDFFKFFPIIMVLYMAIFFGWFWSIAIGLQNKIPESVTMKVGKFKFFFFIPIVYILLISVLITLIFTSFSFGYNLSPNKIAFIIPIVILPLHLFSMFCIFYTLYFVSKTFKTVELQREVKFGDFVGEFFMFWFYFIGIWFIQPKINKIASNQPNTIENIGNSNDFV